LPTTPAVFKYYNTNDWSKEGEISVSCDYVISVAIDVGNQLLYYASMVAYGSYDFNLYQYNLTTGVERSVDVGCSPAGIAVDQQSSLVYLTTYGDGGDTYYPSPPCDRLMIYNSNLVKQAWESGDIGNPAGVCVPSGDVSYKPPVFYLEKVDVNEPNCVLPGDYITYEITYGPNGVDHNNVVLTDYLPYEVDYENILDPNYNSQKHTYTWQIGTLDAGAPNDSVTLTVKVNECAHPGSTISNYCEIESNAACTPGSVDTCVGSWQPDSDIIYVDDTSPCQPGTGMSWRSAYVNLQDALARARTGCGSQIWVAAGTYKPITNTTDPNWYITTFQLVDGVPIYGGFAGNETTRNQRNYITNQTILTGQIGQNYYDAVDYVVTAKNIEDVIVDGFTIRGSYYAGISLNDADITIVNCKLKENYNDSNGIRITNHSSADIHNCIIAYNNSDGIYGNNSQLIVSGCTIESNVGSGLANNSCDLVLKNSIIRYNGWDGVTLENNYATTIKNNWIYYNGTTQSAYGAGIWFGNQVSVPLVRNDTIYANYTHGIEASQQGADPNILNCIIYANDSGDFLRISGTFNTVNYCCLQNTHSGTGNITGDPLFYDNPNDPNNCHLDSNSPCIDKGDPNFAPEPDETDIDGEDRRVDGDSNGTRIVDIGADEYYWSPADFNGDEIVNFIDYALFANAWWSNNSNLSLDQDSDVDYNDLSLFCKDWLWQSAWDKPAGFMMMGRSAGETMAISSVFPEAIYPSISAEQQIEKVSPLKIEQLIKWLEQVWLEEETQKLIDEDLWLKFIESLKEDL